MTDKSPLPFTQVRAAMDAMIDKALQNPGEHVSIAIVDDAGNLLAFAKTGHMRLFGRRHAIRKAYTSAILGMDTGAHAEKMHASGRSISEMGGSPADLRPGRRGDSPRRRDPRRHRRRRLSQRET